MKFNGAVILEQGINFAIVLVKKSVLSSNIETNKSRDFFQPYFSGSILVLAAQDSSGRFEYKGRNYPGVKETIEDLKWALNMNVWNISRKNYQSNGLVFLN